MLVYVGDAILNPKKSLYDQAVLEEEHVVLIEILIEIPKSTNIQKWNKLEDLTLF